jgi:hypothetical protein
MKARPDPRAMIQESADYLQKWCDDKFALQEEVNRAVDNLGEEIASDINGFEQLLKQEAERITVLAQQTQNNQSDIKVCQISNANLVQALNDPKRDKDKFSETLVKQLLR